MSFFDATKDVTLKSISLLSSERTDAEDAASSHFILGSWECLLSVLMTVGRQSVTRAEACLGLGLPFSTTKTLASRDADSVYNDLSVNSIA